MKPALTPIELREQMGRDYLRGMRAHGIAITPEQAQRQATADCELVDAARASGDLDRGGAPKKPAAAAPQRDELVEAQLATGTKLRTSPDDAHYMRFKSLHKNPQQVSERWGAAVARIRRILEGKPTSSNLVVATEDLGELAVAYMDTYAHFMLRAQRPPADGKIDRNPFRGLSDRDASRMFMRLVEDICDKSTGKLGSWFVK